VNAFLEKILPIAEEKNASLSQLVLKWTIEQPGITIALAGARDAAQAKSNAAAADLRLSQEEIDRITAHLNELSLSR
jgi:aryl-alcohol dehydrogenase-like predicted oxidoreductase